MVKNVLVIDDESDIRNLISDILEDEGYKVKTTGSSKRLFEDLAVSIPNVVILDIWLQGSELDGLGILEIIHKKYPYLPIIMISGHGNIETAINSIKLGAYDYIEKPFSEERLITLVKRACERNKLIKENNELKHRLGESNELIGISNAINKIKNNIKKIANSSSRVMISGPPGCGKTLIAKLIHQYSQRAEEAFIVLNAAGKSTKQVDYELFGSSNNEINFYNSNHKISAIELANNGTLFINGINYLSKDTQSKMLDLLQNKFISASSLRDEIKLDVRIISSSDTSLKNKIALNEFREDLYYRLNVLPIDVVPLNQRKEDIPVLCDYFITKICMLKEYQKKTITKEAMVAMQSYDWPGNIRQLKNVIEWLLIMTSDQKSDVISIKMLPNEIINQDLDMSKTISLSSIFSLPIKQARENFEQIYLKKQLERFGGNVTQTAREVGMERAALHRKIKNLNL